MWSCGSGGLCFLVVLSLCPSYLFLLAQKRMSMLSHFSLISTLPFCSGTGHLFQSIVDALQTCDIIKDNCDSETVVSYVVASVHFLIAISALAHMRILSIILVVAFPTWHPDGGCSLLPHIVWTFCPFVSLQSVPLSGTTCLFTSHLCRHLRFSDNDSRPLFSHSYQDTIIWLVCYYHHSSLLSGHLWSLQYLTLFRPC